MRTILFTGYDKAYEPLAELTVPRMAEYARQHGMGFRVFTDPPDGLNIYWTGVARGLELLRESYERVIYLDVDQMVTNNRVRPWSRYSYGFHCSRDWGEDATDPWAFSACGWIAHHGCIQMLEEVLATEPDWRDKPFQEQGPWRDWARRRCEGLALTPKMPYDPPGFLNIYYRRLFNAVPEEVCPGHVPEPWQCGDWCAHLTMLDLHDRISLFHKIKAQL
jgi:hypothetical protein